MKAKAAAENLRKLLTEIKQRFFGWKNHRIDKYPSPTVTIDDNGALTLHWCGQKTRLLICFENNPEDSGWHMVRKNGPNFCGSLKELDPGKFARWLAELLAEDEE